MGYRAEEYKQLAGEIEATEITFGGKQEKRIRDGRIEEIAMRYGYDAQSRQCIEEMAELMQAINKFWRKDLKCGKFRTLYELPPKAISLPSGSEEYKNLVEEISDVEIMLAQMKFMLGCEDEAEKIKQEKIERQIEHIRETEEWKGEWNGIRY